jgi:hypothetical protein
MCYTATERLVAGHCIQGANYSDAFASAFIARINPEIFRRCAIASTAAQKSTGLLPQRTHCYVGRPVDLLARRRA